MPFLEISQNWTIASIICTIAVFIVTGIYTVVTFFIFQQNKKANQISAYLALKKDLTSDIYTIFSRHCRENTVQIDLQNSITAHGGYQIFQNTLQVNSAVFIRDILGNIEDLALFYENSILSFNLVDAGYGYSLLHIGNNQVVRDYIKQLKINGSVYNGYGNLYKDIYKSLSWLERGNYKSSLFD